MMNRLREIFMGEIPERIAVVWFSLLGYIAAIVALELVADKMDSPAVSIAAKLSYIFIFLWLQVHVNRAIWWAFPNYKPKDGPSKNSEEKIRMIRGGRISVFVVLAIYFFSSYIIDSLVESKVC